MYRGSLVGHTKKKKTSQEALVAHDSNGVMGLLKNKEKKGSMTGEKGKVQMSSTQSLKIENNSNARRYLKLRKWGEEGKISEDRVFWGKWKKRGRKTRPLGSKREK